MDRRITIYELLLFVLFASNAFAQDAPKSPPYHGTIFIAPEIFKDSDPTAFESLTYEGQAERRMFDRREDGWTTRAAYLFTAAFDDGLSIEVQVNPEFGREQAEAQAMRYLPTIGQMPTALRRDVKTIWLHRGRNPFGGGNNNLLIHTGQGSDYIRDGILGETFFHEATHTSLDARHARGAAWRAAQRADGGFLSTYARDHPRREDLAETLLMCFAYLHRRDRLPEGMAGVLEATIPNRIKFFEELDIDLHPAVAREGSDQTAAASPTDLRIK